jgi:hypothetical protein
MQRGESCFLENYVSTDSRRCRYIRGSCSYVCRTKRGRKHVLYGVLLPENVWRYIPGVVQTEGVITDFNCSYCQHISTILKREGGQLAPSNSVLVLHCGSGPYSDFVAKTLGVDTPLFLCNTQLYFRIIRLVFKCPQIDGFPCDMG